MRILVGTLYSGENEFEECVASIRGQTYPHWEHFVLRDLPNKRSHVELYRAFMDRAAEFDLFVKVDADMVLASEDFFASLVDKFEKNPWLDFLCIPVHDFFTDSLVNGMHIYRSTVRWPETEENVFVDDSPVPPEHRLVDDPELAPAAWHCRDPSAFQSFHFGLHRGVKFREGVRRHLDWPIHHHCWDIETIWRRFLANKDVRLGMAALGAELAIRGTFAIEHLDYSNPFSRTLCAQYEGRDWKALRSEIRRLRFRNWAFDPWLRREEIYRYGCLRAVGYQCLRYSGIASLSTMARPMGRRILPAGLRRRIGLAMDPVLPAPRKQQEAPRGDFPGKS